MSTYNVEGRNFRTERDYKLALLDKAQIDKLKVGLDDKGIEELKALLEAVETGKYRFYTILSEDFKEELEEKINNFDSKASMSKSSIIKASIAKEKQTDTSDVVVSDLFVKEQIKRIDRRRKILISIVSCLAVFSFGYLLIYNFYNYRTTRTYEQWNNIKEDETTVFNSKKDDEVVINRNQESYEIPEVLDEYKNLLNKNKKLIGWLKIDDTNIDYPVMQTSDNEYYLNHNMNQEYDKNGTIFMDSECDVIKTNSNYILYGHHMRSGQMFGNLDKYEDEKFYQNHKYIAFDTIYEKGLYEVMYVFRSRVYSEEDVVFKYYQFIDANSETEFNSYMNEMDKMSLYDTGVLASFGDRLLTLSTCDYSESNARFVVVAKKIN